MKGTTMLLVLLTAVVCCGGPGEQAEDEWDADTICDQPGLEWACEEPEASEGTE